MLTLLLYSMKSIRSTQRMDFNEIFHNYPSFAWAFPIGFEGRKSTVKVVIRQLTYNFSTVWHRCSLVSFVNVGLQTFDFIIKQQYYYDDVRLSC